MMLPRACYITQVVSVFLLSCGAYADCDGDACSAERAEEIEEEDAAGSNLLLLQTALRFEDHGLHQGTPSLEERGNTEFVWLCALGYFKVDGTTAQIYYPEVREIKTVTDCEECAQWCNNEDEDCLSYECSRSELKCNLNRKRYPRAYQHNYKDYAFCVKGCATGYEKVTGDIKGWGQIGRDGDGESVWSCIKCAQMCSDQPDCKSYECSHSELECNLNTIRHPTLPDNYKDFDFCMKEEVCANGYEEDVGDIGGWGSIDGKGGGEIVANCQQCAGFCDFYPACLSYECSLEELKCNLNELREPVFHENFRTYGFCKKAPYNGPICQWEGECWHWNCDPSDALYAQCRGCPTCTFGGLKFAGWPVSDGFNR